ncbi:MAG: alpha/beta fold hydrolase [Gammaproteobacteria bacterium]|nr:alpha/beta fold hydrolase [Gammaproteobacteria bacterium]
MPRIRVRDLHVYYEFAGADTGEPVVLIMGLGGDHQGWLPAQVPSLTAAGYRCLLFDNRDVGRTDASPVPAYTVRTFADDTAGLLQALGIERAHIVGGSMGGLIAQELALSHPELVRSLTLLSTMPCIDALMRAFLAAMDAARERLAPADVFTLGAPWLFTWRFFANPEAVLLARQMSLQNPYPQPLDAWRRQCAASLTHDSRTRLGQIRAPTHVVVGAEDVLTPPHMSRLLAELIPGATLTIIPGGGHGTFIEQAAAQDAAMIGFLRRH